MTILANVIGWVLGLLLKWKGEGPSAEAVAAREAGAATTKADMEAKANVQIQAGIAGGDAAARAVVTDDGLRKYEAADPNNRDTSG